MNDSILNQQRLYLMTSPKSSYQDFYQIIKVVLPGSIRRANIVRTGAIRRPAARKVETLCQKV